MSLVLLVFGVPIVMAMTVVWPRATRRGPP